LRGSGSEAKCAALVGQSRFDVSDDDVDALNRHSVELEVVGRESVIRDDDVCVLLRGFNVPLKGRLGLVLICFKQRG